jgi:ATP-dependent Clp protease ATP-binding subunit ClpA
LAAEGTLVAAADRQAECKALLQTLGQDSRKSVFLIAESDDAVRTMIAAAAHAIAKKNAPPSLQGRRIIDLTALSGNMTDGGKAEQQAVKLFAEAAAAKEVILFVPAIAPRQSVMKPEEYLAFLKARLSGGAAQCICRVSPQTNEQWVKKDPAWKQIAEVMHVHDTQTNKLPYEL